MEGSLALFDYIIFGCMLAVSAGIGIYYRFSGGRQKTNKEYFLADKNMPVIPVAFSLMASFMSAITLLGVASENYMYGTQFIVINISYIIGTPVAAYVFLPVFFQMQATSSFEYLEKRFCREVRLFASAIFIMQMMLYMSIVLYAPALTLSAVTGLSRWTSVISVGIVCTFYCTIGGIKAVLWTDLFQSILMFSAIFSVIFKGVYDVGGFSTVWDLALKGDRIQFLNIDPDPTARHTVWNLIIGGFFTYTSIYAVNQAQIQRLLTVKNLKKSQMALFLNWPITTLISLTTAFAGLVVYANLAHCDPLLREEETNVKSSDQILPYFVMNSLNVFPGLPGVFVAGIFSGSLSTMSSAINSLTAVTVEDFLRPSFFKSISESRIAYFTKLTAFMFGLLCIFLTYVVEKLGGILQASLTVFNVVGGPMLGLYSLGMLCRRANAKGSMVGYLIALAVCFWIGFGGMAKSRRIPSSHRYVDGCIFASNSTSSIENFTNTSIHMHKLENFMDNSTDVPSLISSEDLLNRNDEYVFPVYKISYMWYAAIGWLICVLVGLCASLFFEKPNVHPILLSPVLTGWHSNKNPVTNAMQMAECS